MDLQTVVACVLDAQHQQIAGRIEPHALNRFGTTSVTGPNENGTVFAVNGVPEPSSIVLLMIGMLGFGIAAIRKKTKLFWTTLRRDLSNSPFTDQPSVLT